MILIYRAVLYGLTLLLVLGEPAVSVSFDLTGAGLYFLMIPLSAVLALWGGRRKVLWELLLLGLFTVLLPGVTREGLFFLLTGAYVFASTWLVHKRKITFFLKGEMFLFAFIHYRMLLFTYSSPEGAESQGGFSRILLFFLVLSFFTYGALLLLSGSRPFGKRKGEIFTLGAFILGVFLLSFLPGAEGITHDIIPETVNDPIKHRPELLDLTANSPLDGGNLKGDGQDPQGREEGEGGKDGQGESGPKLLGIPGNSWQGASSGSGDGEPPRQYAVMIVESEKSSTYLASRYYTGHDREEGFRAEPDLYLNEIPRMRFVETWRNYHTTLFTGREGIRVSVLSIDPEKGVPYFPYTVEPTVNDRSYYPFVYSWNSLSLVTNERALAPLHFISSYPEELPEDVSDSLALDLLSEQNEALDSIIESLGLGLLSPYDRLQAILSMYKSYQYNLGFTEDWSSVHTLDFLVSLKEGDCTEFANGTAMLARRAGIPTRVVTGYLASDNLQTANHRQALMYLQDQIPPLQGKSLNDLFLVTSSHRHAWVQCWFPRYGWIDFETTSQAMAPSGTGDPNQLDVVIPIITETVKGKARFIFPWRIILRFMGAGILLFLAGAYAVKAGFAVFLRSRGTVPGEKGYKALYRLMLIRWADRGYPPRAAHVTPREYAALCPALESFTGAFIEGVYGMSRDRESDLWDAYLREYRQVIRKDRSLIRGIREIFSLKGLYHGLKSR